MNSQLNYHILKSGICENLFVQPLASDRGISLGAALASAAKISGSRSAVLRRPAQNIYLGYGESSHRKELDRLINEYNFPIHIENEFISPNDIARLLYKNQIVALFQGEAGNRPEGAGEPIHIGCAYRLRTRPDQPSNQIQGTLEAVCSTVLEEEVGNFFDINRPEPFMAVIYGVLPGMTTGIEGITHVDGTARLQTVSHDQNPLFYSIIEEYHQISGIPIVLKHFFSNIKWPAHSQVDV